jgi:hypothetical protein
MYLRRLLIDDFLKPRECATTYPLAPGAFAVCCVCETEDPLSATLLHDVAQMSKGDRNSFRNGMSTLLKIANAGRVLSSHYDEKQCHQTHEFTYNDERHTIWRIRTGDMRSLFYYGSNKEILIVNAFPKHVNKLSNGQKLAAERVVKAYVDAKKRVFVENKKQQ